MGLNLREHEPHCLLGRAPGTHGALLHASGLKPSDRNQYDGDDPEKNRKYAFHQRASRRSAPSSSGSGNGTRISLRTRARSGIMSANRIARMLLASGNVPHNKPSSAVGIASEGTGRAGGTSSFDHTVIAPES